MRRFVKISSFVNHKKILCIRLLYIFFVKNSSGNSEGNIKKDYITFSKTENAENIILRTCNKISLNDICVKDKWQQYFERSVPFYHRNFVPLSSYGKFKRGIATGANEFFSLNAADIRKYNFKESEYRYCITRSSQIRKSIFEESDLNNLVSSNENVFVLSLNSGILSKEAEVYIKYGENQGFNNRYLTRNRKCWYELEKRSVPEILFGVFSRDSYKIIRNRTKSITLTCYHGFTLSDKYDRNIIDRLFIYFKSDLAIRALSNNKRIYGDNLTKFEPNDLSDVLVPSLSQLNTMSDDFVKEQLRNIALYDHLDSYGNDFINNI